MQGTVAQLVALTTWGNAFLQDQENLSQPSFYPENNVFSFCEYVKFVDLNGGGAQRSEAAYASDPMQWLARLQKEGVYRLQLRFQTEGDRMTAGFIGGGTGWLIEASGGSGSDFWESRWDLGDRNRTDKKIWRITYARIATQTTVSAIQELKTLETIWEETQTTLTEISAFARRLEQEAFALCFDRGLASLHADHPLASTHHQALSPPNTLPRKAEQLLAAVQMAWVFGGMGSWNDIWFDGEDQQQYDQLSSRLHTILNEAIAAAANASMKEFPSPRVIVAQKPWWNFWS